MNSEFTPEEILRYSRHLVLPEVGINGQHQLKEAAVLIVGSGGLGSPIALYLAACGVGRIGIVDYDVVELSNLQRQVIHSSDEIGTPKVKSARKRMLAINPEIKVDAYDELFTSKNAEKIAEPYEIVIDGTDNLPTRYLMNDLCVLTGKPYVFGAVYRFSGQAGVFDARHGACYRCVFPEPPPPEAVPPCSVVGVMGVVPGIIGILQATEVIKLILGIGTTLVSQLLLYDALDSSTRIIQVNKNPSCKVCGQHPEISGLIDYEEYCRIQVRDRELAVDNEQTISPADLRQKLKAGEPMRLIDLRDPLEVEISKIQGAENIPFARLCEEMEGWDKNQEIVLICSSGFLSIIAARMMKAAGFGQVSSLKGGLRAWEGEVDLPLGIS